MEETKKARVEDLDEQGIINLLERWEMNEFVDFVRVKHLDGVKLLAVSEGIVKLWRPKCKAKKFMEFIAQLKIEPEKYLKEIDVPNDTKTDDNIEAQYQTVNVKRIREQITSTSIGVEEILKKIVPSKSFLYRNHLQTVDTTDKHSNTDEINDRPVTSYTPMDSKNQKRPRRHLHIGFDENPRFSLKNWRLSRQEAYNDRGYYSVKTNPRYNIQNSTKTIDCKAKYKPLSTATELEKFPEEHFYEDLNYNDEGKRNNDNDVKDIKGNVKPKMVKIHELLSSLRLPFFKRSEESGVAKNIKIEEINEDDKKFHIYENNDSITSMYDSINADKRTEIEKQREVEVEEYLEPVQVNRDYCDVAIRQRDDSILSYILTLFESFGIRRVEDVSTVDTDSAQEPAGTETKLDVPAHNGNDKLLRRMETVPDIKRDTSGITTQYIATGIVNLGALAAGVCVAWSSSALPLLTPGHPNISELLSPPNGTHLRVAITQSEASWVASLLCLGALFGAVPAGLISEYFGRKKTLLYLALPLVVSWILVASSPNVYGLYVGRLVGGVAVGAFSVSVPPYIEDIAEKPLLSVLANFYHLHFACGVLFGYIIGMVNSVFWHCVLCSSIPVAFFIAFIFLPESPVYLMSQGKFAEAKTSLRYFRGIDNDIDIELKEKKEHIRNALKHKVTFKELFSTRATIKALVVSFGLMIFQQMSGIYPILFYADSVFKPFDISLTPPAGAIILGFCLVTSTYFSSILLRTMRRRVLLMISLSSMAVCLGSLATYYHLKASNSLSASSTWIPLLTLCIFVSTYAAGIGPIPWLMLREIFPANVTRRATAISAGFHWFLAFGVTKLYQNLIEKVSPGWTLWHFAVTCLVGLIFVYFFVPETKGRTLEEIQDEFDGIHKNRIHKHVIEVECYPE